MKFALFLIPTPSWLALCAAAGLLLPLAGRAESPTQERREIAPLGPQAHFLAVADQGKWGLAVEGAGLASASQPAPAGFEFLGETGEVRTQGGGYDTLEITAGRATGLARADGPGGSHFAVRDVWTVAGGVLRLDRQITVSGSAPGGFLSSITFAHDGTHPRAEVAYFAPGVLYGSPAHLPGGAIGGPRIYESGQGIVQVREDRLPAPLFGVHFADGSALTVLDAAPDGATTRAESHAALDAPPLIDERFRFGSVGARLAGGRHEQGFWFPGSEGEVTYGDYGGKSGAWRRRYHPIREGGSQRYQVEFRFSQGEDFRRYSREAWRWAFGELRPPVHRQDLAAAQRALVDVLASQTRTEDGRAGIPNYVPATASGARGDERAILGFTGKNLEAAEFLLADASLDSDQERAAHDRQLGLEIFASFVRLLRVDPPAGEGFDLHTGAPGLAIPRDGCVYLRSFGDDLKATLRAYRRERLAGRTHPEWLAWAKGFGDWLLTQRLPEGGFPRSWRPGTGEVADASPLSSYNPVPFLVRLAAETGDAKYLAAAVRAADFCWQHGQNAGQFVGGTIDNPNVLDKEAGTLSLEACNALYEATGEARWLERARAAADYAETWIYLWNVPMPSDEDGAALHWKPGAPTVGTQLIATGHSYVDDYMAFDVDEYARLARWTGDEHYAQVAALLLHDTKEMTALPGRAYDLKGPGWQQEHWSFAPPRGFGTHRGWLPWVATSQLKGIFGLREFDPALFRALTAADTPNHPK